MRVKLTERQSQAWQLLNSPESNIILFGGAKGGGKSVLGCWWCGVWTNKLCNLLNIQKSKFPVPLGFMGRRQASDFKKTTLESWKRIVPSDHFTINEQKNEIIWQNRAKIYFGGLDSQEVINKFNSAELAFFFLDQAEEIDIKQIGELRGALRLKINGKTPPYKQLFTANPAECFLKGEFLPPSTKHRFFIPALPTDNPHLPEDYINTLKDAFKYDESLLRAYLYGDWDVLSGFKNLLTHNQIQACFNYEPAGYPDGDLRVIALDLARFGDDQTNIRAFRNEKCVENILYGKKSIEYTYGRLRDIDDMMTSNKGRKPLIVLDCTDPMGCGGIYDRLCRNIDPNRVLGINNNGKADDDRFFNKRSEMFFYLREYILNRKINIDPNDIQLHKELTAIRYGYKKTERKNWFVESKTEDSISEDGKKTPSLKARLGHSPDRMDTMALGVEGLRFLLTEEGKEKIPAKWEEDKPYWQQQREKFLDQHIMQEYEQEYSGMGIYA